MAASHYCISNTLTNFVTVFVCRNLIADVFQRRRHVADRVLIKLCQQFSPALPSMGPKNRSSFKYRAVFAEAHDWPFILSPSSTSGSGARLRAIASLFAPIMCLKRTVWYCLDAHSRRYFRFKGWRRLGLLTGRADDLAFSPRSSSCRTADDRLVPLFGRPGVNCLDHLLPSPNGQKRDNDGNCQTAKRCSNFRFQHERDLFH
jgi:hypothetical protein